MNTHSQPKLSLLLIALSLAISSRAFPLDKRNMLSNVRSKFKGENYLLPTKSWSSVPTWEQRREWSSYNDDLKKQFIDAGNQRIPYDWPSLPATVFLEYVRNGNRSHYQKLSFDRRATLTTLVLAECLEGKKRFIDDIVNGIWAICEETYWGVPAHLSMQQRGAGLPDINEPTVDLFAGETAALLSWTYYLLKTPLDEINPLICERIETEIDRRILTPCLERDDFWWMGFGKRTHVNNWNPWCNSNWLAAVLIMEKDDQRRYQAVEKILRSLDKFINGYPADGGCDEGPGYWSRAAASLFDCLELLYDATNGKISIYNQELIKNMGRYIYRVHISGNYFINFADASALVSPSPSLVYQFGTRIIDERMQKFGAYLYQQNPNKKRSWQNSIGRSLREFQVYSEFIKMKPEAPLLRDTWMPGLQLMAARDHEGSSTGLYLAAKGGHNNESHNHNDVGNFIIYLDGLPMIIDIGVEEYSAKTFSKDRYDIWTMQSAWHNLPTVNGIMQHAGRTFASANMTYKSSDKKVLFALDIHNAYPKQAGITNWRRTCELIRGKSISITDKYKLTRQPESVSYSLITICEIKQSPGELRLFYPTNTDRGLVLKYDSNALDVKLESVEITDNKLKRVWGDHLSRILLILKSHHLQHENKIEFIPFGQH